MKMFALNYRCFPYRAIICFSRSFPYRDIICFSRSFTGVFQEYLGTLSVFPGVFQCPRRKFQNSRSFPGITGVVNTMSNGKLSFINSFLKQTMLINLPHSSVHFLTSFLFALSIYLTFYPTIHHLMHRPCHKLLRHAFHCFCFFLSCTLTK